MSYVGFIEPTRRLPFGARFDYSGRYGASLVAVLLGSYLVLNSNASQISLATMGGGLGQDPLLLFYFVTQLLFAVGVLVFGFLIAPATLGRRLIAAAITVAILVAWFVVFTARITGELRLPRELSTGVQIFLSLAYVVPLVATLGWLIVRERPIVSYLLVILTIIGGVIPFALTLNGAPFAVNSMTANVAALVLGVGIAWAARGLATAFGRKVAPVAPRDEYTPPAVP